MFAASEASIQHSVEIRPFRSEDAVAVARVFRDAVGALGAACYTPEQLSAWSAAADDLVAFAAARMEGVTLVATIDEGVVAFAQLRPRDHIDMLYCTPSHARRGIGMVLLGALLDEARRAGVRRVTAHASLTARACFEKAGFVVECEEVVERRGVLLSRLRVRHSLR